MDTDTNDKTKYIFENEYFTSEIPIFFVNNTHKYLYELRVKNNYTYLLDRLNLVHKTIIDTKINTRCNYMDIYKFYTEKYSKYQPELLNIAFYFLFKIYDIEYRIDILNKLSSRDIILKYSPKKPVYDDIVMVLIKFLSLDYMDQYISDLNYLIRHLVFPDNLVFLLFIELHNNFFISDLRFRCKIILKHIFKYRIHNFIYTNKILLESFLKSFKTEIHYEFFEYIDELGFKIIYDDSIIAKAMIKN